MAPEPELDPEVAELLRAGRPRSAFPLARRELLAEAGVGGAFLIVALAMGLGLEAEPGFSATTPVLVVLFALATRVHFDVGAGYTTPLQLVFVPLLLLAPTPWAPLLVAAGYTLGVLPEVARGSVHPSRLLLSLGHAWFAVGPALVLVALDAQTPDWGDWPAYVLALLAQFAVDAVAGQLREWAGRGIRPELQLQLFGWVQAIDALLAPLGLLAAFASEEFRFAFVLLIAPTALLVFFARERAGRLANALALIDAERAALQEREQLVAGASHELLTPLSVVMGLAQRLDSGTELEPARRRQATAAMRRELLHLRQLIRQFVDYTRLKSGEDLAVRPRRAPLEPILAEVATAYSVRAELTLDVEDGLPEVVADPDRVAQMLMALVSNAVKFSEPGSPVVLRARAAAGRVELSVADSGRGVPADELPVIFDELRRGSDTGGMEGSGIGLYLVRRLAEAHGGTVRATSAPGEGSTFTLTLPAAGD